MGQRLSFLQEDERRTVEANWKEAQDALNAVRVIAEEKAKVFRYQLAEKSGFDGLSLPVGKTVCTDTILR